MQLIQSLPGDKNQVLFYFSFLVPKYGKVSNSFIQSFFDTLFLFLSSFNTQEKSKIDHISGAKE